MRRASRERGADSVGRFEATVVARSAACLLAMGAAVQTPVVAERQAQSMHRFSIRGVALEEALRLYAKVTGRQLIFEPATIGTRMAPDLVGTSTLR